MVRNNARKNIVKKIQRRWLGRQFHTMRGRERAPSSLQECLDSPVPRRGLWRSWFILLIVAPCFYYLVLRTTSRAYSGPTVRANAYKAASVIDKPHLENAKPKSTEKSRPLSSEEEHTKYAMTHGFKFLPLERAKESVIQSPPMEPVEREHYSEITVKPAPPVTHTSRPERKVLYHQPICDHMPEEYENFTMKIKNLTVAMRYREQIKNGGYHRPKQCRSRHKVAILVPFRDRQLNLAMFLYNLHPFLIEQYLEYRIFVVQQAGKEPFNRGRLFNAGFLEASKFEKWDCIIFHDVDLLPVNNQILYSCPTWPRHMSSAIEGIEQNPKFHTLFGGVTAMTSEHYRFVNGYSNMFWGWGGEDNDMFLRIRAAGLLIVRYSKDIATYKSLDHKRQKIENEYKNALVKTARERFKEDGLNNLEYKLLEINTYHLYTVFLVDVNPQKKNLTQLLEEVRVENERYITKPRLVPYDRLSPRRP